VNPGRYTVRIPRHACTPRDTGRAGEMWRLVQEVAVADSAARGWPPERYRTMGTGFVIREMTALHEREPGYGESFDASTWIRESRRGIVMYRETRIEHVFSSSAEWVHVGPPPGRSLQEALQEGSIGPVRAPAELQSAFPIVGGEGLTFPAWAEAPELLLPEWSVSPWWTEMDPMGHTNHPRYVDWADEHLSRWLHAQGRDPIGLVALAERVRFRSGARAGDDLCCRTRRVGRAERGEVYSTRVTRGVERVADILTIRAHIDGRALSG